MASTVSNIHIVVVDEDTLPWDSEPELNRVKRDSTTTATYNPNKPHFFSVQTKALADCHTTLRLGRCLISNEDFNQNVRNAAHDKFPTYNFNDCSTSQFWVMWLLFQAGFLTSVDIQENGIFLVVVDAGFCQVDLLQHLYARYNIPAVGPIKHMTSKTWIDAKKIFPLCREEAFIAFKPCVDPFVPCEPRAVPSARNNTSHHRNDAQPAQFVVNHKRLFMFAWNRAGFPQFLLSSIPELSIATYVTCAARTAARQVELGNDINIPDQCSTFSSQNIYHRYFNTVDLQNRSQIVSGPRAHTQRKFRRRLEDDFLGLGFLAIHGTTANELTLTPLLR